MVEGNPLYLLDVTSFPTLVLIVRKTANMLVAFHAASIENIVYAGFSRKTLPSSAVPQVLADKVKHGHLKNKCFASSASGQMGHSEFLIFKFMKILPETPMYRENLCKVVVQRAVGTLQPNYHPCVIRRWVQLTLVEISHRASIDVPPLLLT